MLRMTLSLSLLLYCAVGYGYAEPLYDDVIEIDDVVVEGNAQQRSKRENPQTLEVVDRESIAQNFSGNMVATLEHIPGIQSMSVGSGFAKPMIRGMGFNRVSVIENSVKQEGQQWGADHGLEIDAFNMERINIHKGPSSLLFGSDAMGGAIEILPPAVPLDEGVMGEVDLLTRTVNALYGGSLLLGYKSGRWFVRARHSEQHFGDLKVPATEAYYLSHYMPLHNGEIGNSAGFERSTNIYGRYGGERFSTAITLSNSYQKSGFYPGTHGLPSEANTDDDGNSRDIDLPYSWVNNFKAILNNKLWIGRNSISWDLGYQRNHREEWSEFHTHYSGQLPPEEDPDKEIVMQIDTYSSTWRADLMHNNKFSSSANIDLSYQHNTIGGYSFLLPEYQRMTAGAAWVTTYTPNERWSIRGGVRYDVGRIITEQYEDEYLCEYLEGQGLSGDELEEYRVRSYALDRLFNDYSLSLGAVWYAAAEHELRFNVGRSFRLPTANELCSNGVHHGSFRHEKGDPTLDSERGWQADLGYSYSGKFMRIELSPYLSYYTNYIYQQPTIEWSMLPDAGQIYEFSQTRAIYMGTELSLGFDLPYGFGFDTAFEYTYTRNLEDHIPLTFTPPTTLLSEISWAKGITELSLNWRYIADQERVGRNEDPTPGANLFGAKAIFKLPSVLRGATVMLSVDNIFNTYYLNHLSYYRTVEIPEPGRNFQLSLKIPF
ncbi:MAG: TonB-dependent receptor [Rikenellaceae bacterium]